jgi:hypothetical protein
MWPEPAAEAGFADVEHRVHFGIDHVTDSVR